MGHTLWVACWAFGAGKLYEQGEIAWSFVWLAIAGFMAWRQWRGWRDHQRMVERLGAFASNALEQQKKGQTVVINAFDDILNGLTTPNPKPTKQ